MGMYDSVYDRCPDCGAKIVFQSKSGDCTLAEYWLDEAPADVLGGLSDKEGRCPACGLFCKIRLEVSAVLRRA